MRLNSGVNSHAERLVFGSPYVAFYLKLGFSIHSVVCRRIQGAGETGEELDDADDADDSGGRRASKTLQSSLQEMANNCRQHYGALDTLADFRR